MQKQTVCAGGGRTRWLLLSALVLLPLSLLARSDASLYPIVFSPDTIISSSDVNANFSEAFRQLRYVLEDDTEKLGALSLLDGNLGVNTNQPGASVGIEGSLSKLLTGTATLGMGNTSVQGTETRFKSEVTAGDALKLDDEVFTVASVSSDTALTVTVAASRTHADAIPYTDEPLLSLKNGADASKLVVDRSGNLGIGTATPAAKLDVGGTIMGGGVLAGAWYSTPTNGVSIKNSGWVDISGSSLTISLSRPATLVASYSVNVDSNGPPGNELVGTRLTVDKTPFRGSGSHFQPFCNGDCNVNLNGNLVLDLPSGVHVIALQWRTFGSTVNWINDPNWEDGFIGGRTITALAFYK